MTKGRILYIAAIIVLLIPVALWRILTPFNSDSNAYRQTHIELGGVTVTADIADTEPVRQLGLSGREGLSEDKAMLFVFQDDGEHSFWMKDMLFPIDIIWLSSEKRVVYIAKNATPESFPSSFVPNVPSRYVIEVAAGFTDRHNISVGTQVSF